MLHKVKKIVAIFFLIVYISTAFGTAINYHYCQGQLTKISILNFGGDGGCNCNPKDMPKDCCKDKLIYEKADNHRTIQTVQIIEPISFDAESPTLDAQIIFKPVSNSVTIYNSDQRSYPNPIFLLNRVFRI